MVKQEHLNNAPIVEALIDIRVKLPSDINVAKLQALHPLVDELYPQVQELKKGSVTIKAGEAFEAATGDIRHIGYRYFSKDKKQILQSRLDGFTLSRLKPYETWDALREEAERLWQLYVSIASPEVITRVALRYINRIEIPFSSLKDFGEYLTALPQIPPELPTEISSFLTRLVMPEPALGATAIIAQALEPVINQDIVPVILDIDVFKEGEFDIDSKEAWDTIDKLRNFKNDIFFKSITEQTKELCR